MCRLKAITLRAMAACLTVVLPAHNAFAEQNQHISFTTSPQNSKYTKQLDIDVGDIPNHILRIFELHRTYPSDPPIIDGLRLTEMWTRGERDLVDGNGGGSGYNEFVMENGDRFFVRTYTVLQKGSGTGTTIDDGVITGGTGQLAGIRGIVRGSSSLDMKSGFNENKVDIDYSTGK
jgi:hypothetical protein